MRRKNTAPATAFCASRGASAGAKRLWNIEIKNRGQSQRRYFSHSKGEWVRVTLFVAFVMFRARLGDARDEEYLRQVGYALVDLGRLADEVPASSARADRAMSTPKERKIRALFLKELIGLFMRRLAKTNLRGKRVPVSNRQE